MDARNAVIQADSTHAIKARLIHSPTDRRREHFPVGSSVQIAAGKQWVGTCRVIAHSAGNILIERGNKILKCPKCKTRMVDLENHDGMAMVSIPVNDPVWTKRRRWLAEEYPDAIDSPNGELTDGEMEIRETIDIRDSPASEGELFGIGRQILDSPDQGEDPMEIGSMFDGQHPGNVFPQSTYVNHGSILCDKTTAVKPGDRMDFLTLLIIARGNVTKRIHVRESRRANAIRINTECPGKRKDRVFGTGRA